MAMASVNPATGKVEEEFAPLTAAALEERLSRSAAAFSLYRRTSFAQRAEWMRHAAAILDRERDSLARTMTREMGKLFRAAIAETEKCAGACRNYADHAAAMLADDPCQAGAPGTLTGLVRYQPLGPVLAVMPWNFPFWQVFRCAVPALMAGNTVLLKHASQVPRCALEIERVFREAGFPDGAFQALLIGSSEVAAIVADPRVAAVSLTGSEGAGVAVGQAAARAIKKVVLELGGSDPFVVMASADLERALATAVTARVQNNGQSCIAAKRFIVEASVAPAFESGLVERMQALRVGDPMDPASDLGPLASLQAARDLNTAVQTSVQLGAKLLCGGKILPGVGTYYAPTVLTDIPLDSPAHRQELFGPVACLYRARGLEDAIHIANDTRFGLGASIWTRDANERERLVNEIDAGMVFVNAMVASDVRFPFGGVKRSGLGRELGTLGLREFTNAKTVATP